MTTSNPRTYLFHGDFGQLFSRLRPDSIDLVLTDPPYGRFWRPHWDPLARASARVLKPRAWFLSYLGNYGLPEVLTALAQSLDYFWMPTVFFDRANYNKHETGLWTQVRPLGLYYKPPKPRLYKPLVDVLLSPKKEKQFHPWQQSVPPALQLIEALTPGPGSWVLDPCAGAATTLLAAHQTGRNAIGFELDARTHAIAKKRLEAAGIEVRTQPDSVGRKSIGFGVSTGREKIPGCAAEKGS